MCSERHSGSPPYSRHRLWRSVLSSLRVPRTWLYLGVQMIRSRKAEFFAAGAPRGSGSAFLQGIITEVLNPKTALFFFSFIPQRPFTCAVTAAGCHCGRA